MWNRGTQTENESIGPKLKETKRLQTLLLCHLRSFVYIHLFVVVFAVDLSLFHLPLCLFVIVLNLWGHLMYFAVYFCDHFVPVCCCLLSLGSCCAPFSIHLIDFQIRNVTCYLFSHPSLPWRSWMSWTGCEQKANRLEEVWECVCVSTCGIIAMSVWVVSLRARAVAWGRSSWCKVLSLARFWGLAGQSAS